MSKEHQHEYTKPIAKEVFKQLGFAPDRVRLAEVLVGGDPIGEFMKSGGVNISEAAHYIIQKAQICNVDPGEFLEGFLVLYQVDAGSYTEDANIGKESLDRFFEFNPEEGNMDFSEQYRPIIQRLRDEVAYLNNL